jgi:hypothetical protein
LNLWTTEKKARANTHKHANNITTMEKQTQIRKPNNKRKYIIKYHLKKTFRKKHKETIQQSK